MNWFCKGLFKSKNSANKQAIQLSVFNYHIAKVCTAAKLSGVDSITEEAFVKLFLTIGELEVTCDTVRKVLTDIEIVTAASSAPVVNITTKRNC